MNAPRPNSRRRGNVFVEFALGFPLVFLVLTGTFQFGYSFFIFNRLESTVRSAARFASMRTYTGSNGVSSAAYITAVKNYAVSGNPDLDTPPVVPGLTPANVDVVVTMDQGLPDRVKVSITGYTISAVFKTITLTGRPFASFRFAGRIGAL